MALVEVKTGKNELQVEQLENYLDIAKEQGFQAVVTISNQIAAAPGMHPTPVDKRKCRKVELRHVSWSQIHTEALMARTNQHVSDPDQAWILSELIRYLEHPRSGAVDFDDMGAAWVPVREAVKAGTLLPGDDRATDVATRWEQLIRFIGMRMGRVLGMEVQPSLTRREQAEPALRLQSQAASLSASGTMSGTLNVPNTVAPINISADLRAGRVLCFVEVGAPREGRPLTRINWLLRQLRDAPEDVRIDAFTPWSRGASRSELLRDLRQDPTLLLDDQKREIRKFQIAIGSVAGTKRGQGKGSFVGSVFELVDKFYGEVVQNLKPWSASPPRLRHPEPEDIAEIDVPPQLPSTALSSQDEQESEGVGIEQFAQQDDPGVDGERISDRRDDPVELFEGLYRSTETTKLNEEPDRAVAPAATQI
ncbi:MAG TPA: hypothetical protein VHX59_13420 [Mycobacteriales bacterium]|nr:hypothetical protein [Mycobacteriales bacterium]